MHKQCQQLAKPTKLTNENKKDEKHPKNFASVQDRLLKPRFDNLNGEKEDLLLQTCSSKTNPIQQIVFY